MRYQVVLILLSAFSAIAQTSITGIVKDKEGNLVEMAQVAVKGTTISTVTDKNGHYELKAIPPSTHTLVCLFMGYKTQEEVITLKEGEIQLLNFTLNISEIALSAVEINAITKTQEIKELPYHVTSINVKPLQTRNLDVNQVLNKSTGVRIREEGGLGSDFNFSLSGFSGKQVKFFLDGIPMDNFGTSLTLNNIPVNLVERIEIYKGVVPVYLGSDALGGAINIVTNHKRRDYIDASYAYGSFNTHRAAVNAHYCNDSTGFTLNVNTFYNYSDNNYPVTIQVLNRQTGKLGVYTQAKRFHDGYQSGTIQLETGLTGRKFADNLLVGLIASANKKEVQTGMTMYDVFGDVYTTDRLLMPTFKYSKSDLFIKGLALSAYASYNFNKSQVIDSSSKQYDWNGDYIIRNDPKIGETGATKSMFRFVDDAALVNFNLSYEYNRFHAVSFNYTQSWFKRIGSDPLSTYKIPFSDLNTFSKQVMGFSYNLSLWDKRWNTTVFSKLYVMDAAMFQDTYGYNEAEKITTKSSRTGYGIASAVHLLSGLQIKLSYEYSYRLPDTYEMFGNGFLLLSNPKLQPEQSNNINTGIHIGKSLGKNKLSLEATAIYRKANNFIRIDAKGLTSQYVNLQNASTNGIEGELCYSYANFFTFNVNATYQNMINTTKYESLGNNKVSYIYLVRIPNIPYLFGNADVGFNINSVGFSHANLSFNWTSSYVAAFYLKWPSLGDPKTKKTIPEQLTHTAAIGYSLNNGRYTISLECRNLTNAETYDNYKLQKPGRAFSIKLRYFISK